MRVSFDGGEHEGQHDVFADDMDFATPFSLGSAKYSRANPAIPTTVSATPAVISRWKTSVAPGEAKSPTRRGSAVPVKLPQTLPPRPSTTPIGTRAARESGEVSQSRPASRLGGGRAVSPFPSVDDYSLMVEGCQTGTFVNCNLPWGKPQQVESRPVSRAESREATRSDNDNSQKQIKRLEAELKRVKKSLGEKTAGYEQLMALKKSDEEEFRSREASFAREAVELNARLQEQMKVSASQLGEIQSLKQEIQLLKHASQSKSDEHKEHEASINVERQRLQAEIQLLQASLKESRIREGEGNKKLHEKDKELEQLKAKLDDAHLHASIAAKTVEKSELEMKANTEIVTKYNLFIQRLCQPQFSVVKDETLAPLDSNGFNVNEGHVLVPLSLLLEGYSFLPPSVRQQSQAALQSNAAKSTPSKKGKG